MMLENPNRASDCLAVGDTGRSATAGLAPVRRTVQDYGLGGPLSTERDMNEEIVLLAFANHE